VTYSKGRASRGTCPGAKALGEHQHTICSHLKTLFKQKFSFCWLELRPQTPTLLLPPTITTLSSFVFSVKCVFFLLKMSRITIEYVRILLFLLHFCTYFSLQTLWYLLRGGRKNVSCPRAHDTLATPLLRRLGVGPPDPRVVTSSYYYKFVESVSSDKCIFSAQKEPSNYSKCCAFTSFTLLHLYFNSNSVSFVEGGRKTFKPKYVTKHCVIYGKKLQKNISCCWCAQVLGAHQHASLCSY